MSGSKSKWEDFDLELQRLAMLAGPAIRYLKRITGKTNLSDIDPISEKRWSEKCWIHYGILSNLTMMICHGRHWCEIEADFIKSFKPCDSKWIGQVSCGKYEPKPKGKIPS